jgi:hypothetical protein
LPIWEKLLTILCIRGNHPTFGKNFNAKQMSENKQKEPGRIQLYLIGLFGGILLLAAGLLFILNWLYAADVHAVFDQYFMISGLGLVLTGVLLLASVALLRKRKNSGRYVGMAGAAIFAIGILIPVFELYGFSMGFWGLALTTVIGILLVLPFIWMLFYLYRLKF